MFWKNLFVSYLQFYLHRYHSYLHVTFLLTNLHLITTNSILSLRITPNCLLKGGIVLCLSCQEFLLGGGRIKKKKGVFLSLLFLSPPFPFPLLCLSSSSSFSSFPSSTLPNLSPLPSSFSYPSSNLPDLSPPPSSPFPSSPPFPFPSSCPIWWLGD